MNVAVIGCGYLGSKVAHDLKQRKMHVTATTRNPAKLEAISEVAQKGELLPWSPDYKDFLPIVYANDIILVMVGAGGVENYDSAYKQIAHSFRQIARELKTKKKIIYTSSTSVYGDHQGKWVDENSDLLSTTEQGKILIETEKTYQSLEEYGWHVGILRLAEIYGPGREISKKLLSYENRPISGNGLQYTNMVHVEDCAGAIQYLIDHHLYGIFNLSDEDHFLRKELYEMVAKKHHLKEPSWDPKTTGMHTGNKRVSIHKIKAAGYLFKHPHRLLD